MSKTVWDDTGNRLFETGVDRGVLYPFSTGEKKYAAGVAWNGLTAVNESPSGAEPTKLYANNNVYGTLLSAEDYKITIEAYTSPEEFDECDGSAEIATGVHIRQQARKHFGFCYRTLIGNDLQGTDYGYILHLVYDGLASPSEKSHSTVNESPEAATLSWEVNTTPVSIAAEGFKPTACLEIDSTSVDKNKLKLIEDKLYGTDDTDPTLPSPDEIIALLSGSGQSNG